MTTTSIEPERFRSPAYLAVLDETLSNEHLKISKQHLDDLRKQAEAGYPLEICGLLIGKVEGA